MKVQRFLVKFLEVDICYGEPNSIYRGYSTIVCFTEMNVLKGDHEMSVCDASVVDVVISLI